MKTQVTLIRHGETEWNRLHRWQGHAPIGLSEQGFAQAAEAACHLTQAGITQIVSSDLIRCQQTTETINAALHVPVVYDPRLREVHVGAWQGMTTEEIQRWDGERFAVYHHSPAHLRAFPGGESYQQLAERAVAALHDHLQEYSGGHILVVTHGGVIRAVLRTLLQLEEFGVVENCSLNRLFHEGGIWQSNGIGEMVASAKWEL